MHRKTWETYKCGRKIKNYNEATVTIILYYNRVPKDKGGTKEHKGKECDPGT